MTRILRGLATALALSAVLVVPVAGDDAFAKNEKAKGAGKAAGKVTGKTGGSGGGSTLDKAVTGAAATAATAAATALADSLLSDADRKLIEQFYRSGDGQATAGKAKSLPPGIAKNLERGKPLPPGIAKTRAPGALTNKIKVPDGYELAEVGTDVLLIEAGTEIIVEVLKGVLAN